MMEDFMLRALLGGTLVALMAAPLGCYVAWGRMAYFGDALAHGALLGVALGTALQLDLNLGTLLVFAAFVALLALMRNSRWWGQDTLLGLLSHGALSLGLVALSLQRAPGVNLQAWLFGDILAINTMDLWWMVAGAVAIPLALWRMWGRLLNVAIHEELARAEGISVGRIRVALMLLLALVILLAMKIVGVLLISALLIIPAATARPWARSPEAMALLALACGVLAVWGGIWGSYWWDTPSGPSIVVASAALFALLAPAARLIRR